MDNNNNISLSEYNNGTKVPKKDVNVSEVVRSMKNRNTVIFCRVSSYGQTGPHCVSFDVQEHKGNVCAKAFNLKVMSVVKMVESAYKGKSCTIKSLITNNKGKNIVIYDVSRFSRNVDNGIELLHYALKCKTRLFFVSEGIVWDENHQDMCSLKYKLLLAQNESEAISRRVSDAKQYKSKMGFFMGGVPKYGYKVIDVDGGRKAVINKYEQAVIKFINLCRTEGTSVRKLNSLMKQISRFDDNIVLEFEGKDVRTLQEPLCYTYISELLNSYEVKRRNDEWKTSMVSSICKRGYVGVLKGLSKLSC